MAAVAATISSKRAKEQHHPYWRNEWRTLFVWFTTWDNGYQITDLDVSSAQELEKQYRTWMNRPRKGTGAGV